jgi:hypothetical protein
MDCHPAKRSPRETGIEEACLIQDRPAGAIDLVPHAWSVVVRQRPSLRFLPLTTAPLSVAEPLRQRIEAQTVTRSNSVTLRSASRPGGDLPRRLD